MVESERSSEFNSSPQADDRLMNKEKVQSLGVKGKVVVITGASSGIGEAAAVMLAERGNTRSD